jgi:hypothetical protein
MRVFIHKTILGRRKSHEGFEALALLSQRYLH